MLLCVYPGLSLSSSTEVWADGCTGCQAAGAEAHRKPALAQGCSNPVRGCGALREARCHAASTYPDVLHLILIG